MNPFRFGVSVWHAPSRAEWIAKARKIEDLGYSSLMLPDHLLTERVAPMPALVSAAEATKRILVGTYVLNNDLRHPVLLAREAAAVDLLTDGRLQLGLGAGWNKLRAGRYRRPDCPGPLRPSRPLGNFLLRGARTLHGRLRARGDAPSRPIRSPTARDPADQAAERKNSPRMRRRSCVPPKSGRKRCAPAFGVDGESRPSPNPPRPGARPAS
jgi:hypothetical protein